MDWQFRHDHTTCTCYIHAVQSCHIHNVPWFTKRREASPRGLKGAQPLMVTDAYNRSHTRNALVLVCKSVFVLAIIVSMIVLQAVSSAADEPDPWTKIVINVFVLACVTACLVDL